MRAPFQILAIPYRKRQEYQFCVFHRADIDQYQFVASVIQLTSMADIPADVISEKHRKLWSKDTFVIPEYAFGFKCDADISISDEHIGFEWLSYDDAMSRLTWDSNKTALYELKCRLLSE